MRDKIWIVRLICILCVFFTVSKYIKAANEEILPDDAAKVSSAVVIQTKTGTGPFDSDDSPGNDSGEDNNIVRSFDQITWTVENTFILKDGSTEGKYSGGYVNVEGTLPEALKDTVIWDTESMAWAQDVVLSEDRLTFTAKYYMTEDEITVPGKQSLVFVAKVLGAGNGTSVVPEVKVWLNGNSDEDKVGVSGISETIVSSAPKYNIKLHRNTYCSKRTTVDYDSQEITGRVYGYSFIVQLYNTDSSKGMKGLEFPKGDITFDLDLNLTRTDIDTGETIDITNDCTPLLWNYKVNMPGVNNGVISGRVMQWINEAENYNLRGSPFGMARTDRKCSIYNSGNISMTQNGSKLSVTISDYEFDGVFPQYNGEYNTNTIIYKENIGCFSAGYFQIIVPENEASLDDNKTYYLTVKDINFSASSISGLQTTTQSDTKDDSLSVTHVRLVKGTYGKFIDMTTVSGYPILGLTNRGRGGDTVMTPGNIFKANLVASVSNSADEPYYIYAANQMYKFDGDAFEPDKDSIVFSATSSLKFNAYYLTKKDGTNWTSQEEMNNTVDLAEFNIYKNKADIPEGDLCVGLFFESNNDGVWVPTWSTISVQMKIKETAPVNQTYGMTMATMLWDEANKPDRSIYNIENNIDFSTYPKYVYYASKMPYVKTEYNEDGSIVSGTHKGSYSYGNTVYVVGANQTVEIDAIDETGASKTNYDLGKNEYDVTYEISPILSSENDNVKMDGITVTLTDTLPKGLTYVSGSSNYGDPEITENSDGTTTLVWKIYNCVVEEEITPLTFKAHIDEESPNGEQYTNKVVISTDKLGNTKEVNRTDTNTIQVINLSSHRLYKISNTPTIEKDGTITYVLSYKNNTDYKISDFQLLDILPYNGDYRGSSFEGTYTLQKLVVTQEKSDGTILSNDNLKILYTSDESIRGTVTSKDTDLGDGWNTVTSAEINDNATAIAVKGEIAEQVKVTVEFVLQTSGNGESNKYINNATAQVYQETEEITTSSAVSQVIKRMIEGIVWYDEDGDGLKDDTEPLAENIEVILTNDVSEQVKNINGDIISSVRTDANGYYSFNSLSKQNYYVTITMPDEKYILTTKEVGSNDEINSKFNIDTNQTDLITKLNSSDLPDLIESNVNAGLVKKPTSVITKYLDLNTNKEIYTTSTQNGRIDDSYTTVNELDNINAANDNKYEFVKVEGQTSGTMTEEAIYVTYYYQKIETSVLVKHVDENGNNLVPEETIKGRIDDEYETQEQEFEDYEILTIPDNATGKMEKGQITVTYVYSLVKGKITVTKVDKNDETKLIEGATFRLEKLGEDGNVDSTFTAQEKTTDSTGIIEYSELLVGTYKVIEIKSPEGYELSNEEIIVEITKDNRNLNLLAKNRLKLILPETGGINTTIYFVFIGIVIMILTAKTVLNKNN